MKSKMFESNQGQKNTKVLSKLIHFLFVFAVLGGGLFLLNPQEASAAIYYVSPSGSNTSPYDTWEKAAISVQTAVSAATNSGDIVEIDGGASSVTYNESVATVASGVTIKGSSELSHSGSVIIDGSGKGVDVFIANSYSDCIIENLTIQGADSTKYNLRVQTQPSESVLNINDVILKDGDYAFYIGYATVIFNRCLIQNHSNGHQLGRMFGTTGVGNATFNHCVFRENGGQILIYDGVQVDFNNCLFVGNDVIVMTLMWNAPMSVYIKNSIFTANTESGGYKILSRSTGTGTYTAYNSILMPASRWGDTNNWDAFVDGGDNLFVSPKLVSHKSSEYSWIGFEIDDRGNFDFWKELMDYANPKGFYGTTNLDAVEIVTEVEWQEMALYIDAGNDIATHGRRSIDLVETQTMTITGPAESTISISCNQTDNSSDNWTGTFTCKESEITVATFDLASDDYNTIYKLANAINSISGWSASPFNSWVNNANSLSLNDITNQSVSSEYTVLWEMEKLWYYEVAEAKKIIEDNIGAYNEGWKCWGFATPFATWSSALKSWAIDDSNFAPAGTTAFKYLRTGSSWDLENVELGDFGLGGNPSSVYGTTNTERNLTAFAESLAHNAGYGTIGGHNEGGIDFWKGLVDILDDLEYVTGKTLRGAAEEITTSGNWTNSSGTTWTRTFTDNSDYNLQWNSPAIDAGTDLSLTTDYAGNNIYGTPDIGAYEYQPPYTIGTNEIDTTGNVRIYADGKFRNTATAGGTTADLSITPSGGFEAGDYSEWMNIDIDTWNTTGTYYKKWTETASNSSLNSAHTVGDLSADTYYTVWYTKDGGDKTRLTTEQADGSSQITFTYDQGYSDVIFEIEEDTTSPAAFTLLSPVNNFSTNFSTSNSQLTFSWNASSDTESGLSHYQLYINGALDTNNISSSAASITPADNLSCGAHTWYIKAFDNAGNSTNSNTFNLTLSCGGGMPVWLLNQINQNQSKTDDGAEEEDDDSDEIKADEIKEKIFAYNKPRLKSLAQEQNRAKNLKQELEKYYSKGKIPVHKKHWHTIVNSYIYGNYPIQAIIQAIKYGGKTVHPNIPFSAWQRAEDYLLFIFK